jgi:glycosyltransferase involved in cell wall biosynthesis
MISFIVPAHNEESYLGRSLAAIHEAVGTTGQSYEIIVVDDASTDATDAVAREHGANVVSVNHRQIAATRNSGARAARGDRLFFVDADTMINARVVASALRAMDDGAAGGGALPRFADPVPLYAHLMVWWFGIFMRIAGITGGACMFCKRDAFHAVGGFNEGLFGGEDAAMSLALRREGRFVLLWPHVRTSGRRVRGMSGLQMLYSIVRIAFVPRFLTRRDAVHELWYESDRAAGERSRQTLGVQLSNALALVLMIAIVAGPLVMFLPWSWTPRDTPLGQIRIGIGILGCHVSLVLWPCAYYLFRSMLRQKRWVELVKMTVLIALCLWFACGGTRVVIWFWTEVYRWLVY